MLPALEDPDQFDFGKAEKAALLQRGGAHLRLDRREFSAGRSAQRGDCRLRERQHEASQPRLVELQLARVSPRSGKAAEALVLLENAFPFRWPAEGTGPFELLAEVLKRLGKQKELIPRLEKLHAADPANVPLACFLAGQYQAAKQFDKAESLYSAALKKTRSWSVTTA